MSKKHDRHIYRAEVLTRTGLLSADLDDAIESGRLPKPMKGLWRLSDIDDWIAETKR